MTTLAGAGGAPLPPVVEFAFPGPLRDALVGAVLTGEKTSTTTLLAEFDHSGEEMPRPGVRGTVVDSAGRPVAVIETTEVRTVPLGEVDLAHVLAEGEGDASVAEWRAGHERFWHGAEMRAELGGAWSEVDDATPVVLERFRLVADLRGAAERG
ncbi:ASCH domain-containing protein [Nocardiopsis potens]|uniref:ASCH domain-containing protein n=1 Tax=Nocardiopsis potens TaxID=1246458 RepID=UPI00035DEA6D|nr:ASCH domain-containing protein [Nocardiopsis potens]